MNQSLKVTLPSVLWREKKKLMNIAKKAVSRVKFQWPWLYSRDIKHISKDLIT